MPPLKKTDNAHLGAKLQLRRYFLSTYHGEGTARPIVFDCCQGDAVIWTRLRSEFDVRYFGVDRKVKKGRLAIDSARLLERGPLPYDIIDVDTYGSPWRHWTNILPHVVKPTTVFLTFGVINLSGADHHILEELGLGRLVKRVPSTIAGRLLDTCVESLLGKSYNFNLTPHDPREVVGMKGSARYFGVRLIPQQSASTDGKTEDTSATSSDLETG
jgi:hypothetical protein